MKSAFINPDRLLVDSLKLRNTEGIKIAIENGADIHYQQELPLRIAAYYGNLEVVKWLITNGADVHILAGDTLAHATSQGHLEVVKFITKLFDINELKRMWNSINHWRGCNLNTDHTLDYIERLIERRKMKENADG